MGVSEVNKKVDFNDCSTLSSVGSSNSAPKKPSTILKWARRILVLFLTFAFLWQTGFSVAKFVAHDTGSTIKVSNPEKEPFPTVTLCPVESIIHILKDSRKSNETTFSQAMKDLPQPEFLKAYWHGGALTTSSVSLTANNLTSQPEWNLDVLPSPVPGAGALTQCATYTAGKKFPPGMDSILMMNIDSRKTSHLLVYIRSPRGDDLCTPDRTGGLYFFKLPQPSPGVGMAFYLYEIQAKKRVSMPRFDLPCVEKANEGEAAWGMRKCAEVSFQKERKCRLPWKKVRKEARGPVSKMPTCESPEDLQAYIDFYLQLTAASPKRRYEMTGCYQPCHHYEYNVQLVLSEEHEYALYEDRDKTLALMLATGGLVTETEVTLFDGLDLVGNVGGYLGLLLGASVLSIYDEVFLRLVGRAGQARA